MPRAKKSKRSWGGLKRKLEQLERDSKGSNVIITETYIDAVNESDQKKEIESFHNNSVENGDDKSRQNL